MATTRQKAAANKNIKKAQRDWKAMAPRAHALAQPEGRARVKPGSTGGGDYFHIEVRPKDQFKTFRTQDVGRPGGIQRVAGKRGSGSWDTHKWLISKSLAHLSGHRLVADAAAARRLLETLGSTPIYLGGDRFRAKPRPNVPEREKPTLAMLRAQQRNIEKAHASWHKHGRRAA